MSDPISNKTYSSPPGYGQVCGNPDKVERLGETPRTILGISALIGLSISAGLFAVGISKLAFNVRWSLAVAIGVGGGLTPILLHKLYSLIYSTPSVEKRLALPQEVLDRNTLGAPSLGEVCEADLLVSNFTNQSFELKLEMIAAATQSIEWSLNFAGGRAFDIALKAVEDRMNSPEGQEVKTHLILSEDMLGLAQKAKLAALKEHFGDRFDYLITERQSVRAWGSSHTEENHVKMLVIDGTYFAVGGSSVYDTMVHQETSPTRSSQVHTFAERLVSKGFRDTDIFGKSVGEKRIADSMRAQFFNLYQIWSRRMKRPCGPTEGMRFEIDRSRAYWAGFEEHEGVRRGAALRFYVSGPEHGGNNPIEAAETAALKGATSRVQFAGMYFYPSPVMREALEDLKAREIETVGIFPHPNADIGGSQAFVAAYNAPNYGLLSRVYGYERASQLLHKKVKVIDGSIAFVGSNNIGLKSSMGDNEVSLQIEDRRIAQDLLEGLDWDIENSKALPTESGSVAHRVASYCLSVLCWGRAG